MIKRFTENKIRIDIKDFIVNGLIYEALLSGKLSYDGSDIVRFIIKDNMLFLRYVYRNTEKITQSIMIDWLDCNYGNKRAYFICPCCGKRVMNLYDNDKYFHCRSCCDLSYKSQSESKFERLIHKSSRIADKLNLHSLTDKPKGMHNKTYQRLLAEYTETVKQF